MVCLIGGILERRWRSVAHLAILHGSHLLLLLLGLVLLGLLRLLGIGELGRIEMGRVAHEG